MAEFDSRMVVALLSVTAGLNVILLVTVVGLRRRFARIERWLMESAERLEESDSNSALANGSSGGAFETFLSEDPARRALSKSEQFAEYRKWRQEKGLNWTNS